MRTFIFFLIFFLLSQLGFGQVSLNFECACIIEDLQIIPNSEDVCSANALQLEASFESATPDQSYTYEWSYSEDISATEGSLIQGQTGSILTDASAIGKYFVKVNEAGENSCEGMANYLVEANNPDKIKAYFEAKGFYKININISGPVGLKGQATARNNIVNCEPESCSGDSADILRFYLKINIFHVFNVFSLKKRQFQIVSLTAMVSRLEMIIWSSPDDRIKTLIF